MKHKTWFKLVLQAIGVLLVGFGAPVVVESVGGYLIWRTQSSPYSVGPPSWREELLWMLAQALPGLLQTAFGIYLMTGGSWFVNKFIPSNRPYCPECGYDLTHNSGDRCAECGVELPSSRAAEAPD